jgi:hypothetical protein
MIESNQSQISGGLAEYIGTYCPPCIHPRHPLDGNSSSIQKGCKSSPLTWGGLSREFRLAGDVNVQLAVKGDHCARRGRLHGPGQQDLVPGGGNPPPLIGLGFLRVLRHQQLAVVPTFHAASK